MRTLKFVKIRCNSCNRVTLIPTVGRFLISDPLHCEECGKIILINSLLGNEDKLIKMHALQ